MLKFTKLTLIIALISLGINISWAIEYPEMPQDIAFVKLLHANDSAGENNAETPLVEQPEVPIQKFNNEGYPLIESYSLQTPERISLSSIDYNKYDIGYFYVVAINNAVNIRLQPNVDSPIVKSLGLYGKINVFEKVNGQFFEKSNSDEWYRVYWYEKEEIKTGYIYAPIVAFRTFNFAGALSEIENLETFFSTADHMGKVNNYKNYSGRAPLRAGSELDAYGHKGDQSAPLYVEADTKSDFRYLSDGQIFDILDMSTDMYYVYVPYFDQYGYIPSKFVSTSNSVKVLEQAIFVDLHNQNIFTLQNEDGTWAVQSISYATSGKEAEFKEKTVPGYYAAIQKKDKFLYLDDVTDELDGYAPYAIRFNGGAYLHGFPVTYKWETEQVLISPAEFDKDGIMIKEAVYEDVRIGGPIDPGMIEYSYTLGTVPLSHKCIRNPTSHALFMYNWIVLDQSIIIISE